MMSRDPILGDITVDDGTFSAQTTVGGRPVSIQIDLDDVAQDAALGFARSVVECVDSHLQAALHSAVRDLLGTYNDGWRSYIECDEAGNQTEVTNPALSPAEFTGNLVLQDITIRGDTCCDFVFGDGGMFAGHAVIAVSLDACSSWHAELFG
ncbi:MAG: DUF2262 domain-containing protein [Planctomycetota bacterium]